MEVERNTRVRQSDRILDLYVDGAFGTPGCEMVAERLRAVAATLKDHLSSSQQSEIEACVSLANSHSGEEFPSREGTHPASMLRTEAPAYATFVRHIINDMARSHSEPLLLFAEQAALLTFLQVNQTNSEKRLIRIAEFAHRISSCDESVCSWLCDIAPASLAKVHLEQSRELIKSSFPKLSDSNQDKVKRARLREFAEILAALGASNIEEKAFRKTRLVTNTQTATKNQRDGLSPSSNPPTVKFVEPSIEKTDESKPEAGAENVNPTKKTEKRTFGLKGHDLRPDRMIAGRGIEAGTSPVCRAALKALSDWIPTSARLAAAQLAWVLSCIAGRHFDKIAYALMGFQIKDSDTGAPLDGSILGISLERGAVVLTLRHPSASKITQASETSAASTVKTDFEIRVALPENIDAERAFAWYSSHNSEEDIDQLLEDKDYILDEVMNKTRNRSNETRLRGAFAQSLLLKTKDLQLTQICTGERLEAGISALNYLVFYEHEIQTALNHTLESLYGGLVPSQPVSDSRALVGAQKAAFSLDQLEKAVAWINTSIPILSARITRTNCLKTLDEATKLAATALVFSTAHRNTKDIDALTRCDISFGDQLVIYRDKPSDSVNYLRFAALARFARIVLLLYIALLERMLKLPLDAYPKELRQRLEAAVAGTGPLFCKGSTKKSVSRDVRRIYKRIFPDGFGGDNMRHVFSTYLRWNGAAAMLVEVNLGHQLSNGMFGEDGYLALTDMSATLVPHIDALLDQLKVHQFASEPTVSPPQTYTAAELNSMHTEEFKAQLELLRSQKGLVTSEETVGRRRSKRRSELINLAIRSQIKDYDGNNPALGIEVSSEQAVGMRGFLISETSDSIPQICELTTELRKELKLLTAKYNWTVDFPPRFNIKPPLQITRASTTAAEQLGVWERALEKYCEKGQINHYVAARLALLFWGDCPDYETSAEWMEAIENHSTLTKARDLLLFDLDEERGARAISGRALYFVSAWRSQGATQNDAKPSECLATKLSIATINRTLYFARKLSLPLAKADVVGETLAHKELTTPRILHFRDNLRAGGGLEIFPDQAPNFSYEGTEGTEVEADSQFNEMLALIPSEEASNNTPSPEKQQKRLEEFLDVERDLTPTVALLTIWAIELRKYGANKRTRRYLEEQTARQYLTDVHRVLSKAFCGIDPVEADPVELIELIETELEGLSASRYRQIERINRFFADLAEKGLLPNIALDLPDRPCQSPRQAKIITPVEWELVRKTLKFWYQNDLCKAAMVPPLKDILELTRIYETAGLRRNEASHTKISEIVEDGENSILFVEHAAFRPIKTKSSARYVILPFLPSSNDRSTGAEARNHLLTPSLSLTNRDSLGHKTNSQAVVSKVRFKYRHAAYKLLTLALRFATGDPEARLHHARHSVVTRKLYEASLLPDPIDRYLAYACIVAEIGHASWRTSISYYSHLNHYALAQSRVNEELLLSNACLEKLIAKPDDLQSAQSNIKQRNRVRQRICRAKGKNSGIVKHPAKREFTLETKLPQSALVHQRMPFSSRISTKSNLSFNATFRWILRFARGISATEASDKLGISNAQLQKLAESVIDAQAKVGWEAIPQSRIEQELALHSSTSDYLLISREHRRFPIGWIDTLLTISRDEVSPIFTLCASRIDWKATHAAQIFRELIKTAELQLQRHEEIDYLEDVSQSQEALLRSFRIRSQAPEKHDANCLKLMTLASLVYAQISDQSSTSSSNRKGQSKRKKSNPTDNAKFDLIFDPKGIILSTSERSPKNAR